MQFPFCTWFLIADPCSHVSALVIYLAPHPSNNEIIGSRLSSRHWSSSAEPCMVAKALFSYLVTDFPNIH